MGGISEFACHVCFDRFVNSYEGCFYTSYGGCIYVEFTENYIESLPGLPTESVLLSGPLRRSRSMDYKSLLAQSSEKDICINITWYFMNRLLLFKAFNFKVALLKRRHFNFLLW